MSQQRNNAMWKKLIRGRITGLSIRENFFSKSKFSIALLDTEKSVNQPKYEKDGKNITICQVLFRKNSLKKKKQHILNQM